MKCSSFLLTTLLGLCSTAALAQTRVLTISSHSGQRLSGKVISSEGVIQEWAGVPPATPMHHIMKAVCAN